MILILSRLYFTAANSAQNVYTYDRRVGNLQPGSQVILHEQGKLTLKERSCIMFRAGEDIHAQLAPEEFSITLNLTGPTRVQTSPLWFDVRSGTIIKPVDHTAAALELLERSRFYFQQNNEWNTD